MIQRINLIEKAGFKMTHGTLLGLFGGAFFLCLSLYALLVVGEWQATTHVRLLTAEIDQLKKEREHLLAREETGQTSGPAVEIRNVLKKAVSWSDVLEDVSKSLPPNVWLASFKSFNKQEAADAKGGLLNGLAKNPQALSSFMADLEATPHFENVVLTSSKEESGLFNFSISCDIKSGRY